MGFCGCVAAILALPILVVIVVLLLDRSPKSSLPATQAPQTPNSYDGRSSSASWPEIVPYDHTVVETEDVSYAGTPRKVVRIRLVTSILPTEERMRATATLIWRSESKRWDEFTVFMIFGEISDFNSGAYGIAEFTPSGLKDFKINDTPLRMLKLKKSGALENFEK